MSKSNVTVTPGSFFKLFLVLVLGYFAVHILVKGNNVKNRTTESTGGN